MTGDGYAPRRADGAGGRAVARWLFDIGVAVAAWTAALPNVVHGEQEGPQSRRLILLLALLLVPLVVRRRWPLPVFAWLVVVSFGFIIWNVEAVPGLAVFIGLYTVTVSSPRRLAYACAALVEAGIVLASLGLLGPNWWRGTILLTGTLGGAVALGLYVGTRRAYLRGLHDRALSLERERDQQGELAAAAERARIAREMHDIIGHHLTVMIALSDGAVAASAGSPERAAEAMQAVSATGRTALAETRRLLGVLRETAPDADGAAVRTPLPDIEGIDALADQVRTAGLPVAVAVRGRPRPLTQGLQLTVYRLVQEALTNVLKHAGPGASAAVELEYAPGELRLAVLDDGAGSPAAARSSGVVGGGLLGMQERVRAYGGEVTSGPGPGGGWVVRARFVLPPEPGPSPVPLTEGVRSA